MAASLTSGLEIYAQCEATMKLGGIVCRLVATVASLCVQSPAPRRQFLSKGRKVRSDPKSSGAEQVAMPRMSVATTLRSRAITNRTDPGNGKR